MGSPPQEGAIWTPQIFPQIFGAFLRDSGTPIFKRQNVEETSAENLLKNLRTKKLRKNGHKNLRTKNLRKRPVRTFRFSGRWKPEKNTKKICAKLAQNPSPKRPRERGGANLSPVFLKPLKNPFKPPSALGTPWHPSL